jgi:hypothetical protein
MPGLPEWGSEIWGTIVEQLPPTVAITGALDAWDTTMDLNTKQCQGALEDYRQARAGLLDMEEAYSQLAADLRNAAARCGNMPAGCTDWLKHTLDQLRDIINHLRSQREDCRIRKKDLNADGAAAGSILDMIACDVFAMCVQKIKQLAQEYQNSLQEWRNAINDFVQRCCFDLRPFRPVYTSV